MRRKRDASKDFLIFGKHLFFVQFLFFNHLDLQIIKFNRLHKVILTESGLGMKLEVPDIRIQPDGRTEVELVTDLF